MPGTVAVDVSLAETSFEYMRRVLAATPKYAVQFRGENRRAMG
ncbi:MAG: hypothetical protein U0992_17455 [Planctomycetaceae bacterium]